MSSDLSAIVNDDPMPAGYDCLRRRLEALTGIDLAAYKERQMARRLAGYLKRVRCDDFFALADLIQKDPGALESLKDFLTINVSEFFRNPDRYADLERRVLPELIERFGTLSVWSAGCSIGAEPYSLSMLLEELDPGGSHAVLGTDVDRKAVETAEEAIYGEDKLRVVSGGRRRHFHPLPDGRWQVAAGVRRRVHFRVHNLLKDPYPQKVHLILCRNVVIYFVDEAKDGIYRRFARSLVPGGYLLMGSTETIVNPGRYGLRSAGLFLYQRPEEGESA